MLAESGLIGFVPLAVWLLAVVRRYLVRVGPISPELEFWRPYFFCGLVAQLVHNLGNDYIWERYFWLTIAFAATLESCYQTARARQAREKLDAARAQGWGSHSSPAPARSL